MSSEVLFDDLPFQAAISPDLCTGYPYLELDSLDYNYQEFQLVYADFCSRLENIVDKDKLNINNESFFQIQPKFSNGHPIRGMLGFHLALKLFEAKSNLSGSYYYDIKSNWNSLEIKPTLGGKDSYASWMKIYQSNENEDFFSESFIKTSIILLRGDRLKSQAVNINKSTYSRHLYNHLKTNNEKLILEKLLHDFVEKNESLLEKYPELKISAKYLFLVIFCREFEIGFTPFHDIVNQQQLFFDFDSNDDKILFANVIFKYIEDLRIEIQEYSSSLITQNQFDLNNFKHFDSKYSINNSHKEHSENEYAEYFNEVDVKANQALDDVFSGFQQQSESIDEYYESFSEAKSQDVTLPPIQFSINPNIVKTSMLVNIVKPKLTPDECWEYINREWGHLIRTFREDIVQLKEQNKINQVSTILFNLKNEVLTHTENIDNGHSQIQYLNSISFHTYNSVWSSFFEKTIRNKMIQFIVDNSELPPLTEDEKIQKKLRTELENKRYEASRPLKYINTLNTLFECIEKIMVDAFTMLISKNPSGEKQLITNHDVKLMSSWYFRSFIKPLMQKEKRIDRLIEIAQSEVNKVLHNQRYAMSVVFEASKLTAKKYDPLEILNLN